jgi:hypothetical protein
VVKLFAMIPRAEHCSPEEFHDHWRHPHASMGRKIPFLRDMVQSHQIHTDLLGNDQTRFEGIGEAWLESVADALQVGTHPVYVDELKPDEPIFTDLDNLQWLFGEEEVIVSFPQVADGASREDSLWREHQRPNSIKMLQFIAPDGNPDWPRDSDAALGRQLGAFRHVRVRGLVAAHGGELPWLGVRELWWPTRWAFDHGVANAPAAWEKLLGRAGGSSIAMLAHAERWPAQ